MAHGLEGFCGGHVAGFEFYGAAGGPEAWGFDGLLEGHVVVDEIDDGLHDGAEDS